MIIFGAKPRAEAHARVTRDLPPESKIADITAPLGLQIAPTPPLPPCLNNNDVKPFCWRWSENHSVGRARNTPKLLWVVGGNWFLHISTSAESTKTNQHYSHLRVLCLCPDQLRSFLQQQRRANGPGQYFPLLSAHPLQWLRVAN